MSNYWMSEDMTVEVKTFESYLEDALEKGIIDHTLRVQIGNKGNVQFYIHPLNADGETLDYKVSNNSLWPAHEAFEKPDAKLIMFLSRDNGKMFTADSMTWYINMLEKLREAVEAKNWDEMRNVIAALKEDEADL